MLRRLRWAGRRTGRSCRRGRGDLDTPVLRLPALSSPSGARTVTSGAPDTSCGTRRSRSRRPPAFLQVAGGQQVAISFARVSRCPRCAAAVSEPAALTQIMNASSYSRRRTVRDRFQATGDFGDQRVAGRGIPVGGQRLMQRVDRLQTSGGYAARTASSAASIPSTSPSNWSTYRCQCPYPKPRKTKQRVQMHSPRTACGVPC